MFVCIVHSICLSELSDTTKALTKLYPNQYGLALIFIFFLQTVMGEPCETNATMRTFSNAVILKRKKKKDFKRNH